ncbi:hypothetical protein F991_02988 [Acinetobacter sp. CIP-A165]|uniref:hypothetical protein n=1 Tax=Acinetobacter sp. CIP-A165 TaxID=40373 RepID=UPI0002CFD3F1|nr:hypothetical protein [Acinetobacter sp. CIP-A165]ENU28864.1 hypothetical protein F991_02988 [Acinetobacter sp. CIP-A165]
MTSPSQTKNAKLLWMIIAGISIIVVLFFAIQWFLTQKNLQPSTYSDQPIAEEIISQEAEEANTVTPEISTIDESEVPAPIQLVQESLIKQPLPANDSLAKEEIAKLDDIHHQLKDQQKDLKQQHEDVDALLRLKEEQIKLLEAQIQQAQSS